MSIAVIGHTGMVGSQVYDWFCEQGACVGISLDAQSGTWDDVRGAEWVIVCVPTPFDAQDPDATLRPVRSVLGQLAQGQRAVIKSTMPPGATRALSHEFAGLRLFHNPEFLSRRSARADYRVPEVQFVGVICETDRDDAWALVRVLPRGARALVCSAESAEIIKLAHNLHGAMQVVFANHVHDAITACDAEPASEVLTALSWAVKPPVRYWDVNDGGYRGYGGPCFPKDMRLWLRWCAERDVPADLMCGVDAANAKLLGRAD